MEPATFYNDKWHEQHMWTNRYSSRALFIILAHYWGDIESYLDIGTADGHLPLLMSMLGIRSVGVDIGVQNLGSRGTCQLVRHDLRTSFNYGERFDLVTSWEVAEHIQEDCSDVYADTVANHVRKVLVFSAATPKQGGHGHVNEQPHEYWIHKFQARGLKPDPDKSYMLRNHISAVHGPAWWYGKNMMVFTR